MSLSSHDYHLTATADGVGVTISSNALIKFSSGSYMCVIRFTDGTVEQMITIINDITPPDETGILGDVNGDDVADSADAVLILRASVNLEEFTPKQNFLGDVNGDGEPDSSDALEVLRYSVDLPVTDNIGESVELTAA